MLVEITGKRAMFSRPELRAERYSYEVPTPSALEGILKCIYWKPEMEYHIQKIYVLNRPRFETIMENSLIRKEVYKPGEKVEYGSHDTTPRTMRVLKDVKYIVDFTISTTGTGTSEDDCTEKHVSIFTRRAQKGQNFKEPSLGLKEFPCEIRLLDDTHQIPQSENKEEKKLGRMLHHIEWKNGKTTPVFYNPIMRNGIIDVNESLEGPCTEGWLFQNLAGYYNRMQKRYDLPIFGYSSAKLHFEAVLNEDGKMVKFAPLHLTEKGKVAPVLMSVPDAAIRTSNDSPNFLWDNSTYVFGMGESGPTRQKLFRDKIIAVMENSTLAMEDSACPETKAVVTFLRESKPEDYMDMVEPYLSITKGVKDLKGNIVFRLEGKDRFVHDCPEVKEKWEAYFYENLTGKYGEDIITGEKDYLTDIHPLIKGSAGSSGMAKLVSIDVDATAFECYGMKRMENSPFGRMTTHKYSTVLNWMLSNQEHKVDVDNESFIFWTEHDNEALLRNISIALGNRFVEEAPTDFIPSGEKFYIAGIKASTKGRLFIAHYQDFVYGESKEMMKDFLSEISVCYKNSKYKPCYDITERWEKKIMEEEKNERSKAYLLGALQACIEKAQKDAITSTRNRGTPTITDRYIKRASETPAAVFPKMLQMAQIYTTKVDYGMKRKIAGFLKELNQFEDPFPERLNAKEKCNFFIGYYETNDSFYIKKNKEEENTEEKTEEKKYA